MLGVIVIVRLGTESASLLDWIVIGLLGLAGAAGLVNRQAVSTLDGDRSRRVTVRARSADAVLRRLHRRERYPP